LIATTNGKLDTDATLDEEEDLLELEVCALEEVTLLTEEDTRLELDVVPPPPQPANKMMVKPASVDLIQATG
jgi:hypothetical protein